jgi:uncharacterized protein (TIGR02145 family)
VFFPAAGYRTYYGGFVGLRGNRGYYWSSRLDSYDSNCAYYLSFGNDHDGVTRGIDYRANGSSVRCVQE